MTEQSAPQSGFNPTFNLDKHIANLQPNPDESGNEAMIAAQKQNLDPKTGLLSERAWRQKLEKQVEDFRTGDRLIVLVADVDGLKQINDELGHLAGDQLIEIGGRAFDEAFSRPSDTIAHGAQENDDPSSIAHLGGDEYAASVFEKARSDSEGNRRQADSLLDVERQAERINERFKELLAGTPFAAYDLRISVGAAEYKEGGGAETLFAEADYEMFRAKYARKAEKAQSISEEDRAALEKLIPLMENLGHRIDDWLKDSVKSQQPPAAA